MNSFIWSKYCWVLVVVLLVLSEVVARKEHRVLKRSFKGFVGDISDTIKSDNRINHRIQKRWLANTIIAGAMFSSLAFDIYMHIDKCCSTVKGACTKRDEFYEKRDELEATAERIDSIYSQDYPQSCTLLNGEPQISRKERYKDIFPVENQNRYLLTLAMKTEELSIMMASINTQIDRYIISLDNDIQRKINEISIAIANTDEAIESFGDITIKYNSVFSTVGGTINRIRGFISWGAYIALTKLAAFAQSRAAASVATANPSKFALFTQSVSAKYNVLKQSALKSDMYVKMSNFASNHKVAVERIKTVGTVAMTAAYVAWEIFAIIKTLEKCKDMKEKAVKAIAKINPELEKFNDLEEELNGLYVNVTMDYNTLKAELVTTDFRGFIEEIFLFANYSLADNDDRALQEAVTNIENYQAQIPKADNDATETLVDGLISAFLEISVTIKCYVSKFSVVNYVIAECKTGQYTLDILLATATSRKDNNCNITYFTIDEVKALAIESVTTDGYQADCILNNEIKKKAVCSKLESGTTNVDIESNLNLSTEQVSYFSSQCTSASVSSQIEKLICNDKKNGDTLNSVIGTYNNYMESEVRTAYENCTLPDDLKEWICLKRTKEGYSLSYVQNYLSHYKAIEIEEVYSKCGYPVMDGSTKGLVCVFKNTYSFTLQKVEEIYGGNYGSTQVEEIYDTC